MQAIAIYIGAFILSMACGFFSIPVITRFCVKHGLFDMPNIRKVHKNPIPRLGGITFVPSMLLASVIVLFILSQKQDSGISMSLWTMYFGITLFIIYVTGIVDDIMGLSASTKFLTEVLATMIIPFSGLYINNLYGLFGIYSISVYVGIPLTILLMVFITNSINLIDGIDGLSASLTLIALIGFLIAFNSDHLFYYCLLIASLMGVLIPYLRYNMFGNAEKGQKIFMGDSGSLSLGFILSFLAVKYCMDTPNIAYDPDRLLWAWTFLAVPCFDVVRVFFFRILHHKSPFHPDKNHIHHKLLAIGLSQHKALAVIILLQLTIIATNALFVDTISMPFILIADIFIYCLAIATIDIIADRGKLLVGKSGQAA